ncbi:MAG: AAA family ATPase [Clostridia bacterium]|nr:AAA family ATPase [Clostridia bacterium]MBQ7122925.1 AAA family ATPase [Clostridia bacterium]
MNHLINQITELLETKSNAVIAIDGMCASGKTTFAELLSERFGIQVIHTDDFFLPFEMRTDERLSRIGGNIHYERFIKEVITPINERQDFEYRIFDCSTGTYCSRKSICANKPIIIEGAYSLHPEYPDIYDLKIFFQTSSETQLTRIEKRNGSDALKTFKDKWIPFENRYFDAFKIKEKCDITIENR